MIGKAWWYRSVIIALSAVIILFTFAVPSAQAQNSKPKMETGVSHYAESVFRFNYPSGWIEYTDSEKLLYKQDAEVHSRKLFQAYHGRSEDYETLVPHVFGIRAPQGTTGCVGVLMRIPAKAEDYIDTTHKQSIVFLELEKIQGKVREVLSNHKTKIGDVPAHITDIILSDGERHTVVTFHFADAPSYAGTMVIVNRSASSEQDQNNLKMILDSLVLVSPNQ